MPTKTEVTTDRQISALSPKAKPYEAPAGGVRGLAIRVFPTGTKSFEFRYVALNGVRRRLPLGNYPGLTLADARDEAGALRVAVTRGGDPAADRAAARTEARTGETLSELAEAYFKAAEKGLHGGRGRPKRAGTIVVERNRFDRHIAKDLGAKRFREIRRSDVRAFMRDLATSGKLAADSVSSVGTTLRSILAFAVYEERLESNPATGLTRPLALQSRDRMFDDKALAALWKALEGVSTLPPPARLKRGEKASEKPEGPARASADLVVALALRFAMLTLARRNDIATARWNEIDLVNGVWIIPASRFKGGRAHAVPLSEPALAVLKEAAKLPGGGGVVVFPSPLHAEPTAESPPRAIGPNSLTRALTRTLIDLKLTHGSPHDFRRAGATTLTGEKFGFRRFIVGMVLGHAAQDGAAVTQIYDRNQYLADKRAALNAWGKHLLELAAGKAVEGSNVREMRPPRG